MDRTVNQDWPPNLGLSKQQNAEKWSINKSFKKRNNLIIQWRFVYISFLDNDFS